MSRPTIALAACIVVFSAAGHRTARADESLPARSRKVFEQNNESVVKVTAVAQLRLSAAGRPDLTMPEREEKVRADGTIVGSDGLVALSLSAIDPSRLIDGRDANSPMGPIKVDASATLKEVELILGDGTEIPAVIVFKDEDLDLAFLRPKSDAPEAKGATFDPVDLDDAGTSALAEHTLTVARLDEPFANEAGVMPGHVSAVITRPRTLYMTTNVVRGCPSFTLDGRLLGIGIVRHRKVEAGTAAGNVVLPAAEVRKLIAQIPAAGAEPAAAPEADRESPATEPAGAQ